jgi:hypothetical protein
LNTGSESPRKQSRMLSIVLLVTGAVFLIIAAIMGISDNIPGILLLLAGSCALLIGFLHRTGASRTLGLPQQMLYWAPRALCIVFAALISLLALDVFEEHAGFWDTSLALLMHLIPTFLMIGVLVLSWRREWIGGVLFIVLGVLYVVSAWGRFPFGTYLVVSGPLMLIGILFLLNWRQRAGAHP